MADNEWKMVPVEPTDAMVKAAHDAKLFLNMTDAGWRAAYSVMLTAAPSAPAQEAVTRAREALEKMIKEKRATTPAAYSTEWRDQSVMDRAFQRGKEAAFNEVVAALAALGAAPMNDLENRLRTELCISVQLATEAADALAAKDARIAELEKALRPFACAADRIDYYDRETYDAPLYAMKNYDQSMRELLDGIDGKPVTVSHLRAARAALGGQHDQ